MLTNRIARVHHTKVPPIGAVVIVHVDDRWLRHDPTPRRYRKFKVVSYPGFSGDRWAPFSQGHLVHIEALDRIERLTMAAHWLEVIE